jgi:hypothetical protein
MKWEKAKGGPYIKFFEVERDGDWWLVYVVDVKSVCANRHFSGKLSMTCRTSARTDVWISAYFTFGVDRMIMASNIHLGVSKLPN